MNICGNSEDLLAVLKKILHEFIRNVKTKDQQDLIVNIDLICNFTNYLTVR